MLNKQVKITQINTGAVYTGNLVGYRGNKSRFCLNNVTIHSKVTGIISPKNGLTRWFRTDKFKIEVL